MPSKTALDIKPSQWRHCRPFKVAAEKRLPPANLAEATSVARRIAKELVSRFGAKKVILFGSLARGGYTRWADIDLAVWGIPLVEKVQDVYRKSEMELLAFAKFLQSFEPRAC